LIVKLAGALHEPVVQARTVAVPAGSGYVDG
jgi:hypothetical protein